MFLTFKEDCGHICTVNDRHIAYVDDVGDKIIVALTTGSTCSVYVNEEIHVSSDIDEALMIAKSIKNGDI